jgi:hypothetical protein
LPYQVLKHGDYVEVRLEGVLESALDFEDQSLEGEGGVRKLLLDFGGVTEVRADAYLLAEQARSAEARGFKIAVYAPRPAVFGLNRQALQLGAVHEGVTAGVFASLEEARIWLQTG